MKQYCKITPLLLILYVLIFGCVGCSGLGTTIKAIDRLGVNYSPEIIYTGYGGIGVVSGSLHNS